MCVACGGSTAGRGLLGVDGSGQGVGEYAVFRDRNETDAPAVQPGEMRSHILHEGIRLEWHGMRLELGIQDVLGGDVSGERHNVLAS